MLNKKEKLYYDALIADYNLKNDNSFLSVLFECHPFDNNMKPYFYDEINETFKDSYKKIIFGFVMKMVIFLILVNLLMI